jgi:short subunit dehydrogenase-like uncharacterized protein
MTSTRPQRFRTRTPLCSRVQRMDIVVFGATGLVGRLVAEYLTEHAPAGVTVGLAGRSPEKLELTAEELGVDWPLVVADISDEASLAAMARGARVVATTVGPYWPAGLKLVDACIAAGTHYLDLTGEILFVRESILRHDRAGAAGARIVHSCGFDSVPSDLGVLMLHEAGSELSDTTLVVKALKGGFSGGTLTSLTGQIDEVRRNGAARQAMLDPNALAPGREPVGERDLWRIARDPRHGWIGPFVMGELQHARRPPQRHPARLRPAIPLPRNLGVQQPGDRPGRHLRPRRARRRPRVPADPQAARPLPPRPRRGAEREVPRQRLLQD